MNPIDELRWDAQRKGWPRAVAEHAAGLILLGFVAVWGLLLALALLAFFASA